MHNHLLKKSPGFSLLELIISISLISLLSLVVLKISQDMGQRTKTVSMMGTRNVVLARLRYLAGNLGVLASTLTKPENSAFLGCIFANGTGCATMSQVQPALPLTLYDPSGTIVSPAYFDEFGLACSPTAPNCFIEITTSFLAQCTPTLPSGNPVPPQNCSTGGGTAGPNLPAEFVAVVFTVQQNPNTISSGALLKPLSGKVYIQSSDIAIAYCSPYPSGGDPLGVCP